MGVNQSTIQTSEEFALKYLTPMTLFGAPKLDQTMVAISDIDWTAQGKVSAVKNQGQRGSCWTFSATGTLESFALFQGQSTILSEQQLIDCSKPQGNQGCNGGWPASALNYVKAYGITTGSAYPQTKLAKLKVALSKSADMQTTVDAVDQRAESTLTLSQLLLMLPTQAPTEKVSSITVEPQSTMPSCWWVSQVKPEKSRNLGELDGERLVTSDSLEVTLAVSAPTLEFILNDQAYQSIIPISTIKKHFIYRSKSQAGFSFLRLAVKNFKLSIIFCFVCSVQLITQTSSSLYFLYCLKEVSISFFLSISISSSLTIFSHSFQSSSISFFNFSFLALISCTIEVRSAAISSKDAIMSI